MDDFFDDLIESGNADFDASPTKPDTRAQKFPCPQCGGSGHYRGARVHQEKSHCFSCRGTGYFKTDPRKLAQNREKVRAKKIETKRNGIDDIELAHPEMVAQFRVVYRDPDMTRSDFIRSLAVQLFERGKLSENQIAAWYRGKAKQAEREEQRAKEAAERPAVDLTPIRTMFEKAVVNGYKKPAYRAEGLVINRAPDHGTNPGALYVKDEAGEYMGKIIGTTFHPVRNAGDTIHPLLAIAADPLNAAIRYGQRTGKCACCGRTLTNHDSIDLGIGPICRERWGL